MNRLERTIVGVFISLACAVSTMIVGWWASACLSIYHVWPISERGIAAAAFAGLGLGILLSVRYLKIWIAGFYQVDWRWAVPIYLFWMTIATAWFMGLPIGTFVLGILAGLYIGRRYRHAGMQASAFARQAGIGSLWVALATGIDSLGIGVLVLGEKQIVAEIQRAAGTSAGGATMAAGVGMVLVLCLVLAAAQYVCTRRAAIMAFGWGKEA